MKALFGFTCMWRIWSCNKCFNCRGKEARKFVQL